MIDRYILKKGEVMAVKLEDNETSLDQVIGLLGSNYVGFVYGQDGVHCAIKWNPETPPLYADVGDWIIRKNSGDFEVLKNEAFLQNYASLFTVAEVKKIDNPTLNWSKKIGNKFKDFFSYF